MIFILEDNYDRIENFKIALGSTENHTERTVPDAINWLSANVDRVILFSLDNDLYVPEFEGDEGEGWQLCEWILSNSPKRPLLIHTTNFTAATKMETSCADAGWDFMRIIPYNGFDWIHQSWIKAVREMIG
jgi:hypothetical protein